MGPHTERAQAVQYSFSYLDVQGQKAYCLDSGEILITGVNKQ